MQHSPFITSSGRIANFNDLMLLPYPLTEASGFYYIDTNSTLTRVYMTPKFDWEFILLRDNQGDSSVGFI